MRDIETLVENLLLNAIQYFLDEFTDYDESNGFTHFDAVEFVISER